MIPQLSDSTLAIITMVLHEANASCSEHHAAKIDRQKDENVWHYMTRLKNEGHPMFDFTNSTDRHPITNEILETE